MNRFAFTTLTYVFSNTVTEAASQAKLDLYGTIPTRTSRSLAQNALLSLSKQVSSFPTARMQTLTMAYGFTIWYISSKDQDDGILHVMDGT